MKKTDRAPAPADTDAPIDTEVTIATAGLVAEPADAAPVDLPPPPAAETADDPAAIDVDAAVAAQLAVPGAMPPVGGSFVRQSDGTLIREEN